MTFSGIYPIRSKIDKRKNSPIDNSLGCDVTYDHSPDVERKRNKFTSMGGTKRRKLKNKTRKEAHIFIR